jgi:uncharacterized membrane protein YagU involved in acid resistance
MRLSKLQAILLGGLIAGTIDIGAASLISGRDPTIIAQFIAGGLLGKAALTGGMQTISLGVVLQWAMSMIIAAIFVFASERLVVLRRQWLLFGILYGVPVYFVMTYVVVPLSAWHRVAPFSLVPFAENLAAMMVFGLIVSFFASRSS